VLGYALFGDIPERLTLLGAGIVIASTIYITWREAGVSQSAPVPAREE
jgi:drug/metabolite transporter (DMT)-like permease